MPYQVMAQGLVSGLLLGFAAAAIPAFIALRTKPVEALAVEAV
jgi:ABC-type antimicrobial peptide transport system permease subunit